MSDEIKFTLDGEEVIAQPGQTIWEVAKDRGNRIPHRAKLYCTGPLCIFELAMAAGSPTSPVNHSNGDPT